MGIYCQNFSSDLFLSRPSKQRWPRSADKLELWGMAASTEAYYPALCASSSQHVGSVHKFRLRLGLANYPEGCSLRRKGALLLAWAPTSAAKGTPTVSACLKLGRSALRVQRSVVEASDNVEHGEDHVVDRKAEDTQTIRDQSDEIRVRVAHSNNANGTLTQDTQTHNNSVGIPDLDDMTVLKRPKMARQLITRKHPHHSSQRPQRNLGANHSIQAGASAQHQPTLVKPVAGGERVSAGCNQCSTSREAIQPAASNRKQERAPSFRKRPQPSSKANSLTTLQINERITGSSKAETLLRLVVEQGINFNMVNTSTALHRLATTCSGMDQHERQHIAARKEVDMLLDLVRLHADRFKPRNIANVIWALARLNRCPSDLIDLLTSKLPAMSKKLNGQNVANIVWGLGSLGYKPTNRDVLRSCDEAIVRLCDELTMQGLSSVLVGYSRLHHHPPSLVLLSNALAHRIRLLLLLCGPNAVANHDREVVNALVSWGEMKAQGHTGQPHKLIQVALEYLHLRISFLSTHDVSSLLCAMAKLDTRDEALIEKMMQKLFSGVTDPQSHSDAAGLCVSLIHGVGALQSYQITPPCAVLQHLALMCGQQAGNIKLQYCITALQVLSKQLPMTSPESTPHIKAAVDALLRVLEGGLGQLTPMGMVMLLRTMPSLNSNHSHMLDRMADKFLAMLSQGTFPSKVPPSRTTPATQVIKSYSMMNHYRGDLVDQILKHLSQQLNSLTCQELSQLTYALASFRHLDAPLLSEICRIVLHHGQDTDAALLANVLCTLAKLPATHVLQQLDQGQLESSIATASRSASCVELMDMLWALSMMGWGSTPAMSHVLEALQHQQQQQHQWHDDTLRKLAHSSLLLCLHGHPAPDLPPPLLDRGRRLWIASAARHHISSLQHEVGCTLGELGVPYRMEALTHDAMFSLDIVIEGTNLAVEVDGPTHYTASLPCLPLSTTTTRHMMLQQRGWTLVCIPFFKWPRAPRERQQYLAGALTAAGYELPTIAPNNAAADRTEV